MITQTIPDSPTDCMRIESLDRYTEATSSNEQSSITREWIQSLPQDLRDEALLRFCKVVEAKPTLCESFALNQVLYRTISGGTFTESADNVAERTGCDRKTILKGLELAVSQNILDKNVRPGTSTEYFWSPVEEWKPEPERVVRKTDIRTKKVDEFPATPHNDSVEAEQQVTSNSEVVHETDTNNNIVVVSLKELEEQQQVSILVEDTPKSSPWKYVGQGLPRVYMPPELDALTGSKIESIHDATKRPRQGILKEAVDLLYNRLNHIPSVLEEKPTPKLTPIRVVVPQVVGIPDEVLVALANAGIDLGMGAAERLWLKYSDKFEDALAYTVAQDEAGKIRESKSGYFRRSLEEGWNLKASHKQNQKEKDIGIESAATEQQEWYEWACATGICDGKPYSALCPTWNGELGVFVYSPAPNPSLPPWVPKSISQAMREFPLRA